MKRILFFPAFALIACLFLTAAAHASGAYTIHTVGGASAGVNVRLTASSDGVLFAASYTSDGQCRAAASVRVTGQTDPQTVSVPLAEGLT